MLEQQVEPEIRGIYAEEDESPRWREEVKNFPNKVPRFETQEECLEFMRRNVPVPSNPEEPHLNHCITMLVTWSQIERYLLPRREQYLQQYPMAQPDFDHPQLRTNRWLMPEDPSLPHAGPDDVLSPQPVHEYLTSRLDLPIHQVMSTEATVNTLKYMFFHLRSGIYVMIRQGRLMMFVPFVNKDYRNTWGDQLQVDSSDGSLERYYAEKREAGSRLENYIPDKNEWWANGNIVCNEHCKPGFKHSHYWGDQFIFPLKDMIAEACRLRYIPDCEFFINKRDYPNMKFNVDRGVPVEPYGFIYDKDDRNPDEDVPLAEHLYNTYAPIASFYTSKRFADLPLPPSEDWEAASGLVFPPSFLTDPPRRGETSAPLPTPRTLFTEQNFRKFERPWEGRVPTAFFRGTATGGGTTADTNQRLHLCLKSHEWGQIPELNGSVPDANGLAYPYLDAKIVGWNMRDKKIAGRPMTYIRKTDFPFSGGRENFFPIYEQSKFKYLVYVEGHCAACRYGFMMRLGSVILKVESSCVADSMWYFPLLRPYYDHVPVKADLSDLQEKIEWCRANDDKCQEIAQNALRLYERYVARDGLLDYLQVMLCEVAKRWYEPPKWAAFPPPSLEKPFFPAFSNRDYCCTVDGQRALCLQCELDEGTDEHADKRLKHVDSSTAKSSREGMMKLMRKKAKAKTG